MKSDYVVEVTVKENIGDYTPQIDKFKGSPEKIVKMLTEKYSSKKTILDWLYKPLEVSNEELKRLLKRKE